MYLVIDNQAPIHLGEESQMHEVLRFALAIGQDLVGGDGDWSDLFSIAGVLADIFGGNCGLIEEFIDPLAHSDRVCRKDQGVALGLEQDTESDNGFSCAAGEDDHTAAAAHVAAQMEDLRCVALVVAQVEGRTG